jgi:hypothetical protein
MHLGVGDASVTLNTDEEAAKLWLAVDLARRVWGLNSVFRRAIFL